MTNDLTLPDSKGLAAAFSAPEKVDQILCAIESEVKSFAPDLETAKGRAAITSLAFKVTQSKTAFDAVGKSLNEDKRAAIKKVDAERRKVRERLDELRDYVKAPLVEWEQAEAKKQAELQSRVASLDLAVGMFDDTPIVKAEIERLEAIEIDASWDKFEAVARIKKKDTLDQAAGILKAAEQRDADAAELARLREAEQKRAEKAAKERQERDAAEAAKAKAQREKEAEREKAEAAEAAKKQAEEKAEANRKEAEARHKRELAASKKREKEAAERERQRIADKERKEREAEERRAANARRRNKVKSEIANSIAKIKKEDIPQALLDGLVAH